MKKIGWWVVFVIVLGGMPSVGDSCTTLLVGNKATADGSVMHAHNEDMGFTAVGRLWHAPSAVHSAWDSLEVPYVSVPTVIKTHRYWASGNAYTARGLGISEAQKAYDNILVGMNEHGVTLSCNWMWSKEDNLPQQGIRRYALRQLVLERAKTAKEAVRMIGDFIETYGQADWGGLGYCLADPREAWIVETTTAHWVARRIKDDEVLAVANRFTIGEDYDMAAEDLRSFAQEQGWYDASTGPFNFREAYGAPDKMDQAYDVDRERRVAVLLKDKKGRLRPEDLFSVLRDRYDGTEQYTKPLTEENWRDHSQKHKIPRTISTNLCQSSSVAHLRADLPVSVGAVWWVAMGDPGYTGYFPIYAGARKIPAAYARLDALSDLDAAWWIAKLLQRKTNQSYESADAPLKRFWCDYHMQLLEEKQKIEKKALALMDQHEAAAIDVLTQFTFAQAEKVWRLAGEKLKDVR